MFRVGIHCPVSVLKCWVLEKIQTMKLSFLSPSVCPLPEWGMGPDENRHGCRSSDGEGGYLRHYDPM